MSPQQLLEQLESLGTIDPKILAKIRREIENPAKSVQSKAVLSYLVKKGELTDSQAAKLLKGELLTAIPTVDEFEIDEPPVENSYDTDDLTGLRDELIPDPTPAKKPEKKAKRPEPPVVEPKVSAEQTVLDQGQYDYRDDVVEAGDAAADVFSEYDGEPSSDPFVTSGSGEMRSAGSSLGFKGKVDKRDQWSTKWLYIGFGILGFLLIMGGVLYIATMGVKAEDQYAAAKDSFDKLAYLDAAKKFEEYYTSNPKHKYVASAKALRAQCLIASSFTSKNWVETITSAEALLPPLVEDEDSKIDDIRDDLAHMLPESLKEITEKAKKTTDLAAMETELAKCEKLKTVIDNNVYIPTSRRNKPLTAANLAKIDNNLRILQGQIDKEKDYNSAISEIQQLGISSETDKAFAVYKKLIRNYGDLAAREQLRDTMLEISKKEVELVRPIEEKLVVANLARPSPIKNSVVLANRVGTPVDSLKDEIINFLADGSVYGIQADDGTILWRRFVGYQTSNQPEILDQDLLLVSDQQVHDLVLLKRTTGDIVWRTEIEEPFLAPAFNEAMIVVTTVSGKVMLINRETGDVLKGAQLPQAANVSALVAERDPYIYQPGSYSNLYVLSSQDLSCREVHYLGHYNGSIAIPPVAWSGYLLVAINGGDSCDLMVLKPAKNGLELELIQVLNRITSGPVTTPMQRFGRWMLLAADNGEIRILELQPSDDVNPVTKFASDRFDNSSGQPAFVLTEGSNLWIAGLGISRFRIQRTQGTFQRDEIIDHADTFLTPLKKLDDNIFHISRRQGSGMLSASMVDAKSLTPKWRTDFGGQVVGSPQLAGDSIVAISNQGDLFKLSSAELRDHYANATARASTVVEDLKFSSLVNLPGDTFACLGPNSQEDFLFAKTTAAQSKLMRLPAPANHPACQPIAINELLIVPSTDGQVTRIDPKNGRMVGTPFQPPISPGTQTEWFEPTLVRDSLFAIASGNGADDTNQSMLYLLDAAKPTSLREVSALTPEEPFKSRLVNDGRLIYGVVEGGGNDYLAGIVMEPKLEISNKVGLPGHVVAGPWLVEQGILLKMDNDQLMLVAADLSTVWTLSVPNDQLAAAPENVGSVIMISFQNGKLLLLNPATGEVTTEYDLRQPIVNAPTRSGNTMFFSGMDGTVHEVDFSKMSGAN